MTECVTEREEGEKLSWFASKHGLSHAHNTGSVGILSESLAVSPLKG